MEEQLQTPLEQNIEANEPLQQQVEPKPYISIHVFDHNEVLLIKQDGEIKHFRYCDIESEANAFLDSIVSHVPPPCYFEASEIKTVNVLHGDKLVAFVVDKPLYYIDLKKDINIDFLQEFFEFLNNL
jgi:hypothetical protein